MDSFQIEFEPSHQRIVHCGGETFHDAALRAGLDLVSFCNGKGTCGRCKIRIIEGNITPVKEQEKNTLTRDELESGFRLACQTFPLSNCIVFINPDALNSLIRAQVDGIEPGVSPDPVLQEHEINIRPPSLTDSSADSERVLRTLAAQSPQAPDSIDIILLQTLSADLRRCNWQGKLISRGREVIAFNKSPNGLYGLAIDLGTTKIAGYLVNLRTGLTAASGAAMNPQSKFGEDVMTRLTFALESKENLAHMQGLAVAGISSLAAELSTSAGIFPSQIADTVIVGNTAMHHLLLRLPIAQLAVAPFLPAVSGALDIKARDIGLYFAPGSYVNLLPNIAGFVGADHVADLLAVNLRHSLAPVLLVDIGTNTEISLVKDGTISSTSCASGPAFEGAHIRDGMRASPGAIEKLNITRNSVEYHTIGQQPPVGLCGSGIIDAVAQLRDLEIIDDTGKLKEGAGVENIDGQLEFIIALDIKHGYHRIGITQGDIREVQLAKAAISTGIQLLLASQNCEPGQLERVLIAGSFGSYIDIRNAIRIGMLPNICMDRYHQIGNASGIGAKIALLSKAKRKEAKGLAREVVYLDMVTHPRFQETFLSSISLK